MNKYVSLGYVSRDTANLQSLQVCKFAIKSDSKNFLEVTQKNRTPSTRSLSQTPFFRFWIRSIPVIQSFWLKLKTITRALNIYFAKTWRATSMGKSRISDIIKCRLQEKCFLLVFWNSWKFARERSIMKSFD